MTITATPLKLFSITDDPGADEGAWWDAVWAPDEVSALVWADNHYSGELPKDEPVLNVGHICEQTEYIHPGQDDVHHERRPQILRLAGWKWQDEYSCECCDLAAMDIPEFAVCGECILCPECRALETDDPCPDCQGAETECNSPRQKTK